MRAIMTGVYYVFMQGGGIVDRFYVGVFISLDTIGLFSFPVHSQDLFVFVTFLVIEQSIV